MRLDDDKKRWEIGHPDTQVVPVTPDINPDTNPTVPNIDIRRLVEGERRRWGEQETPQAKF